MRKRGGERKREKKEKKREKERKRKKEKRKKKGGKYKSFRFGHLALASLSTMIEGCKK